MENSKPLRFARLLLPILILRLGSPLSATAKDFPPAEQVFSYSTELTGNELSITWKIEKGYYLYRKRLGFISATPGVTFGPQLWPKGEIHSDEFFGPQEVYRGTAKFAIPLQFVGSRPQQFEVKLKLQGCADAGLCYPPSVWTATVNLPAMAQEGGDLAALIRASKPSRGAGQKDFLQPDEAFKLSAIMRDRKTMVLKWDIAAGYYLYKDRITVAPVGVAKFGKMELPPGEMKRDEFMGNTFVYHAGVDAAVHVVQSTSPLVASVTYQGCAEAGLCYNPITKTISLADRPAADASPD